MADGFMRTPRGASYLWKTTHLNTAERERSKWRGSEERREKGKRKRERERERKKKEGNSGRV